jgi:hypothetical protein
VSTTKHTPGPWRVCGGSTPHYKAIAAGDQTNGRLIIESFADLAGTWNAVPQEQQDANAHLIAAAPDLLASCVTLLGIVRLQNGNLHDDVNEIQRKAEAAIAKAEGTVTP